VQREISPEEMSVPLKKVAKPSAAEKSQEDKNQLDLF
jgi:hypothetical protein